MKCEHPDSKVINSRTFAGRRYRRRECRYCLHRWSTIEYEVELKSGHHGGHMKALRERVGLTARQQEAIGELIQAFLEPEDE